MIVECYRGAEALPFAETCARIHADAFAASGARVWSAEEFTALFARSGSLLLIAADSFLLAEIILDRTEILTLAVGHQSQRQGRARLLVEEMTACSIRQGATSCMLEVAVNNDPAIALYTSAGYVATGRRKNYFRQNGARVDAAIMEITLQ